jgi:hypothetical protein
MIVALLARCDWVVRTKGVLAWLRAITCHQHRLTYEGSIHMCSYSTEGPRST